MMRISTICLDGFGLFRGRFECRFPDRVALIVGDNETGKSTLVAAIGAILFGFASENEKAAYAPPPTDSPRSGYLEIEAGEKTYRISRDFASNKVRVESIEQTARLLFEGVARPAGRSDEKEKYSSLLNKIFGIATRDLFFNSVFVEQGRLPAKMEAVVRRIVSGGSSADYALVEKNLKDKCEQLTVAVKWGRAAGRKPRLIEQLIKEIEEKTLLLETSRNASGAIIQLRKRLADLDERLRETETAQAEKTQWQRKVELYSSTLQRRQTTEDQLNRLRKEKENLYHLKQEIQKAETDIDDGFKAYLALPDNAEEELAELAALRRNINDLQQRRQETKQSAPAYSVPKIAVPALAGGLVLAAVGLLFLHGVFVVLAVLIGVAAATFPFVSAFAALQSARSAHQGKVSEIDDRLRIQQQQCRERESRYPLLGTTQISDMLDGLRRLRRLQAEREKKAEALKQYRREEEVEAEFNALSNELLPLTRQLGLLEEEHPRLLELRREAKIGSVLEEAKKELIKLDSTVGALTKEREDVRYQLARAEAHETVSEEALEEEIEEKRASLERLKLHREAYLKAVEVLEESISEFRSSHLARIEEKTSEYLSVITGKTLRVCLDERLEPLYVEQGEQRFEPGQLSQGAHDQLCFGLRLAAIGEICDNVHLPIVLDDPFVNFDERRLAEAQKMLDALSGSHQIILLTHERRYGEWMKPAVVLGKASD